MSDAQQFDIAWIFHDSALEGVVYSRDELRAALANEPADASLAPVYDEIRNHKSAIDAVREMAAQGRAIDRECIEAIYAHIAPGERVREGEAWATRAGLYLHNIAQPDEIGDRLDRLVEWINDPATEALETVEVGSKAHFEILQIYPYAYHSGALARLVMNLLLMRAGYPPVVIHATKRQRYYEALRDGEHWTAALVLEALSEAEEAAN